jgi:hypothetical protein
MVIFHSYVKLPEGTWQFRIPMAGRSQKNPLNENRRVILWNSICYHPSVYLIYIYMLYKVYIFKYVHLYIYIYTINYNHMFTNFLSTPGPTIHPSTLGQICPSASARRSCAPCHSRSARCKLRRAGVATSRRCLGMRQQFLAFLNQKFGREKAKKEKKWLGF